MTLLCIKPWRRYDATRYLFVHTVMYERVAEIKTMVSKKEFEKVIELLLFKKRNIYSFEKKDQVVYFADTKTCELYKKSPLLLRYRRNNELLETTLKISGLTSPQIEKIITKYGQLPNHEIKCEIDQVPNGKATVSVGIKHLQANIFQAFSFTNKPKDFLSEAQQKLFDKFSSVDCNDLKFTIPIQSKAFKFRTGYKEFESLTLEEWKIPHLF